MHTSVSKVTKQADNSLAEITAQKTAAPESPQQIPLWAETAVPAIQFSLKVNTPGDKYEQEADRVAEQVMRMGEPTIQRKTCACGRPVGSGGMCEDCKRKQLGIQRKASGEGGQATAPPIVNQVLSQAGRPLDRPTCNFMESRFGQDFGHVRVHIGSKAAESAEAVTARAFAVGQNIVFGAGQYRPGTESGQLLIAHELTHTLQQNSSHVIRRTQRGDDCAVRERSFRVEWIDGDSVNSFLDRTYGTILSEISDDFNHLPPADRWQRIQRMRREHPFTPSELLQGESPNPPSGYYNICIPAELFDDMSDEEGEGRESAGQELDESGRLQSHEGESRYPGTEPEGITRSESYRFLRHFEHEAIRILNNICTDAEEGIRREEQHYFFYTMRSPDPALRFTQGQEIVDATATIAQITQRIHSLAIGMPSEIIVGRTQRFTEEDIEEIHTRTREIERLTHERSEAIATAREQIPLLRTYQTEIELIEASINLQTNSYRTLVDLFTQKRSHIQTLRTEVGANVVWQLPTLVVMTREHLGIQEGTLEHFWLTRHIQSTAIVRSMIETIWAAFAATLAIAATVTTGGTALLLAGGAFTLGAAQFAIDLSDYRLEEAAASFSLDPDEALAEDPSILMLIISAVGSVLDLADVVVIAFRTTSVINRGMRATLEAGELLSESRRVDIIDEVQEAARQEWDQLDEVGRATISREQFTEAVTEAAHQHLDRGAEAIQEANRVAETIGGVNAETRILLAQNPAMREAIEAFPNAARAMKLCNSLCLPEGATLAHFNALDDLLEEISVRGARPNYEEIARYIHDYVREYDPTDLGEAENAVTEALEFLREDVESRFIHIGLGSESGRISDRQLLEHQGSRSTRYPDTVDPTDRISRGAEGEWRTYERTGRSPRPFTELIQSGAQRTELRRQLESGEISLTQLAQRLGHDGATQVGIRINGELRYVDHLYIDVARVILQESKNVQHLTLSTNIVRQLRVDTAILRAHSESVIRWVLFGDASQQALEEFDRLARLWPQRFVVEFPNGQHSTIIY